MKITLKLSKQLNEQLDVLALRFEEDATAIGDSDQFAVVKEETTPIFDMLEQWEEATLALVKERKLTLHPQQIVHTRENFELLLMHSYFKDIRIRKYMETNKSCRYILELIIEELVYEGTIN